MSRHSMVIQLSGIEFSEEWRRNSYFLMVVWKLNFNCSKWIGLKPETLITKTPNLDKPEQKKDLNNEY